MMEELFDLGRTLAADYLRQFDRPWQALEGIESLIRELGRGLGEDFLEISPQVWVHRTATVAPTAYLGAPCIIGAGKSPQSPISPIARNKSSAMVLLPSLRIS